MHKLSIMTALVVAVLNQRAMENVCFLRHSTEADMYALGQTCNSECGDQRVALFFLVKERDALTVINEQKMLKSEKEAFKKEFELRLQQRAEREEKLALLVRMKKAQRQGQKRAPETIGDKKNVFAARRLPVEHKRFSVHYPNKYKHACR